MSDSIGDVLGKRRYDEPPELTIVRDFVRAHYGEVPKLKISQNSIIIYVSNSALAGSLRMRLHTLKTKINSDKKLIIRIG